MLVIIPTLLEQELIPYPAGSSVFQGMHTLHLIPRRKLITAPIDSTGSAGLIQTIQQYIKHSWVAAVLGTIATTGWVIQGLGNALYYRQVGAETRPSPKMLISA